MSGVDARYLGLTANQLAKIATDLKAENAKFIVKLNAEHIVRQNVEIENAKLRELVGGLEHCAGGFVCDSCPLYDPLGTNHRRCESLEQELGIEVPS